MKTFLGFITTLIIVGLIIGYPLFLIDSSATVKDCIVKTERVVDNRDSYYLIYGKNEVYKDTDSWIRLKFNSSDLYRDIQAGQCYSFNVQGWRLPFFSTYRNIYKIN